MPPKKSLLEKPEGNTLLVLVGGITLAVGWFVLSHIDQILALLAKTIVAGGLFAFIVAVTAMLMNDNFRTVLVSRFEGWLHSLTAWVVAIDPIPILRNYLKDMKKKLKIIEMWIAQLWGQVQNLRTKIQTREDNVREFFNLAAAAERLGDMDEATVQASMGARESEYIDRLRGTLKKMEDTSEVLGHMKRNLDLLSRDTDHRVGLLVDEYETVKVASKIVRGAQDLIEGDRKKELFDQTCEIVVQDVGNMLGEMDRFMKTSEGTFKSMDLKNEVFNEKGLEMLATWKKTGILSYEKNRLRVATDQPKVRVAGDHSSEESVEEEAPQRPSSFAKIFEKR
jgi:hypothetical protein